MNLTTLKILWRRPAAAGLNGILKGYRISVLALSGGNGSRWKREKDRNITTNERGVSVTLFSLTRGRTYDVRVAAFNAAGVGRVHGVDRVTMGQ